MVRNDVLAILVLIDVGPCTEAQLEQLMHEQHGVIYSRHTTDALISFGMIELSLNRVYPTMKGVRFVCSDTNEHRDFATFHARWVQNARIAAQ
jgi:hypothetical protein